MTGLGQPRENRHAFGFFMRGCWRGGLRFVGPKQSTVVGVVRRLVIRGDLVKTGARENHVSRDARKRIFLKLHMPIAIQNIPMLAAFRFVRVVVAENCCASAKKPLVRLT